MEIDDTKVMLFLIHSVHVVTRYLTKNSCVLLQTEATDLSGFEVGGGRSSGIRKAVGIYK